MRAVIILQPHYVMLRLATERLALVRDTTSRVVVVAGRQGIPGPAGNALVTGTAGAALGGHRMVTTNASGYLIHASNADPSHAGRVVGMTTGAVSSGATATVQTAGAITEAGRSWIPGSLIWVTTDG